MTRGAAHLSNVHLNAVYTSQPIHHALCRDLARKPPHDSLRLREIWSCGSPTPHHFSLV